MQGSYVDHIASTNDPHFKNLWQKGFSFNEGVPLEVLKDIAWEQINILGGAIRFNHLDWVIRIWKGSPPPSPVFGRSLADIPTCAQIAEHRTIQQPMSILAQPSVVQVNLAELPEDSRWFLVQQPASVSTSTSGDCQSIPNVVRGKRHWIKEMKEHAVTLARILKAHGVIKCGCRLCPNGSGWDDHILGPQHSATINKLLGERPAAEVREEI